MLTSYNMLYSPRWDCSPCIVDVRFGATDRHLAVHNGGQSVCEQRVELQIEGTSCAFHMLLLRPPVLPVGLHGEAAARIVEYAEVLASRGNIEDAQQVQPAVARSSSH